MRNQQLLSLKGLVLALTFASIHVQAAENLDSLLPYLPPTSNTLAVVRVREILESPRAKQEGWREQSVKFLAGADAVPVWVDALALGGHFYPGDTENWSASVLLCPDG